MCDRDSKSYISQQVSEACRPIIFGDTDQTLGLISHKRLRAEISAEFVSGKNRFNGFKMAAVLNIKATYVLSGLLFFKSNHSKQILVKIKQL